MVDSMTRQESVRFLYFAIKRVWMAAGACEQDAHYVADAICFAHKQGKLNQGLGVYEALDIALEMGLLNLEAQPEVVNQGPTWASIDGHQCSGYWCLNLMAELAIEKARATGIAIVFGSNHNDAGSFARYVYKAYENDMMAFSSNNTVPLAAPFGGMLNLLSCPPFDSIVPSGDQAPIWTSVALAEFYDADISEAAIHNKRLKGPWLIDPVTGELSDDVRPYAQPIGDYGRVWDCTAAGQIEAPRTYALNMWNEALTSIINPLGVPSTAMPSIEEVTSKNSKHQGATVGGSYYICINPAIFGPIEAVKSRSDEYISAIEKCPPRPGHTVRVPGSAGHQFLKSNADVVEVMSNHWNPFFVNIAGKYGLDEAQLRAEFDKENHE